MFKTIEELKSFQKQLRPLNDSYIYYYLNTIYQFLLMREESPGADINEVNSKNLFSNTLKQKANENGISLRNFLQYFDIQEFMCERVFNYLDKTKTGQLTKNEFVNGLDTIFYGNIQELYKMVFYMCDFNEKGKIHKFNMKLILSYIPVKTYEEQQKYIKNINNIIDNYFTDLDRRFPGKNINVDKEIDFEMYKNDIEEYIKDKNNISDLNDNFNNNGSFLLFIQLMSYIYKNNPFNKENMNYCKFLKNKFLMKVPKKQNKPENNNTTNNTSNNNNNNTLNEKDKDNKNSNNVLNSADSNEKEQNYKIRGKNRSNSLYNSKMKKNININTDKKPVNEILELNNKILSTKELNLFNPNKKKVISSEIKPDKDKDKNKDIKELNNLLFSMNLNELKKNKMRNSKVGKTSAFNLTPPKNKKSELNVDSKNEENNNNPSDKNLKINEYADILYKYCEEDSSKFIKKYYGELRGKDILFFTSKLKNELCTIWNISKCIIIQMEKVNISKYNYFPIKLINYNQSFCLLYFEEIEKRNIFLKKCEENTDYIKIEDLFEFKEKIGEGHFGLVKKCIEKSTGKEYAVKIMNKNKIKPKDYPFLIQERNYMVLIKHPHIVSLIQDYEDENCLYFVMEYFKGGDLAKYMSKIKANQKEKEKNLERMGARIIKIIAQGVEYLNQFGIVHRDLKPENIVFGIEDDIKSIKIIDLGVAITLPFGKQSSDPIGTLAYIAPEIYTHTPYSYKVDVWSIGILLYWITSGGEVPFDDEKNDERIMGKKVVFMHQEYPEKYFGDKSKGLINLIDKALEKKPEKRINIHEFLNEEWLNKYNK